MVMVMVVVMQLLWWLMWWGASEITYSLVFVRQIRSVVRASAQLLVVRMSRTRKPMWSCMVGVHVYVHGELSGFIDFVLDGDGIKPLSVGARVP